MAPTPCAVPRYALVLFSGEVNYAKHQIRAFQIRDVRVREFYEGFSSFCFHIVDDEDKSYRRV